MLNDYIDAAMRHAVYKQLESGEYFGSMLSCQDRGPVAQPLRNAKQRCEASLRIGLISPSAVATPCQKSMASDLSLSRQTSAALWANQPPSAHPVPAGSRL